MSTDSNDPDSSIPPDDHSDEGNSEENNADSGNGSGKGIIQLPIEQELKNSYLTYAMSVIVSRALPDVRDGLKPSQRRILVAMNDLNLSPGASRVKCAKISGDTSGNYHPHGESVIYPTLVRMAQDWSMRHTLIDKQGNFGSIAGLPPAAMRYTEARMSAHAALLLEDLKLDTVDYVPTYDEVRTEPTVLPSKYPNLLVNGANGIAVGMATSIPPHNLREVCQSVIACIDDPDISIDELMEICPGPDFPTGGIICGRTGIRRGYHTGRSTITLRARAHIEEVKKRHRIVITEIPYQQARDRIEEKIAAMYHEGKIKEISGIRNESDLKEPVRLIVELKRDADPEVVLNQLYQFTPLQETFSIIFLALVDRKPRVCSFKVLLEEFIRHRIQVIRRRTQFLLAKARQRKHTVEGLLIAHANIDEVIRVIRASKNQAEAKVGLMQIECPGALLKRILGDVGFEQFQEERGIQEAYTLTPVQADAILRMTLGSLVNLEQDKLGGEFQKLLDEIEEYNRILSDEANILAIIREDLTEIARKYGDARRTEISGEEVGYIDLEDLITEESMVVSISHSGYIKRTPASVYRAQRRGGKGLKGAKTEDEDPIEHLFVASTHAYLMFFTNFGKIYWQKVYDLPQLKRESRGRAIVNLLKLAEGEKIADCRAVRDFNQPGHFLVMATKKGLVKKTVLKAYSRPKRGGIIAIKLKEGDEVVDVIVTGPGDEIMLSSSNGMAIRFRDADVRAVGRNSSGVRGIRLGSNDEVVGMVAVDPDATLLTVCENGYGKRTKFGPHATDDQSTDDQSTDDQSTDDQNDVDETDSEEQTVNEETTSDEETLASASRYRTQGRGGKGVRDIKTTDRNGKVIGIARVDDTDEILMMTARGKLQKIAAKEISTIGRNTKGVRIMSLGKDDSLAAVVRVPKEEETNGDAVNNGNPENGDTKSIATSDDPTSEDATSNDTTGNDTTGNDTTGNNTTGEDTTGNNTTGNNTTGEDTTGEDTTGEDTTGEDTTGEDTTGEDTTGEDATSGETSPKPEDTTEE